VEDYMDNVIIGNL